MALYRALLRLYPKDFREEFGPDLLALHQDLAADRGSAAARRRTALDLIVTVPRYRLEHLMSEPHSTTALTVVIFGLAAALAALTACSSSTPDTSPESARVPRWLRTLQLWC